LRAGDTTYVTFGAQRADPVGGGEQPAERKSPLLGIVGGLFLAGGLVLWFVAVRRLRVR